MKKQNYWKCLLVMVLAVVLLCGLTPLVSLKSDAKNAPVNAAAKTLSGTCGENVTWELDMKTGELTISGTGAMDNYDGDNKAPWDDKYDSIKTVTIRTGITQIGNNAFNNCLYEEITIPDSVISIGERAFAWGRGPVEIKVPDSVVYFGNGAFDYCCNVVYNGDDDCAPWGALSLNGFVDGSFVYKSENKKELLACSSAVKGDVIIPDGVTSIGEFAFANCDELTGVTIPDSVTDIGHRAFSECDKLANMTIGKCTAEITADIFEVSNNLTRITVDSGNRNYSSDDNGVLYNKDKTVLVKYPVGKSRTAFAIPESVTAISGDAFRNCKKLTSVDIPNSVINIEVNAFSNCGGLTKVTIPDSVTDIEGAFKGCDNLETVIIGNGLTEIGFETFLGCKNLKNLTIGNNVESIDMFAFHECKSLTSVTLPDGMKCLVEGAFAYCNNLESITIPVSLEEIGDYAFSGCDNLKFVYYNGTKEQWKNINIGSPNKNLYSATIYYNDCSASISCGVSIFAYADNDLADMLAPKTDSGDETRPSVNDKEQTAEETTVVCNEEKNSDAPRANEAENEEAVEAPEMEKTNVKMGFWAKIKAFFVNLFSKIRAKTIKVEITF